MKNVLFYGENRKLLEAFILAFRKDGWQILNETSSHILVTNISSVKKFIHKKKGDILRPNIIIDFSNNDTPNCLYLATETSKHGISLISINSHVEIKIEYSFSDFSTVLCLPFTENIAIDEMIRFANSVLS